MKWLSPCTRIPTMAFSSLKARIGDRITNRKVVHHLSPLRRHAEITMHVVIVESADAGGPQPQRFRRQVQALADGARLEMHIAITAVARAAHGTLQIADHRKRDARVARQILPEAQARGRNALVAALDPLQLGALGPEPVHARFQTVDAMRIQIELDEMRAAEIGRSGAVAAARMAES